MIHIYCGTRPEWIKAKPVVYKLHQEGIDYKVILTGQHPQDFIGDLSGINLIQLDIDNSIDNRLNNIAYDILKYNISGAKYSMVVGDTTSAFISALSSYHHNVPVIHLEAGLRTYDNNNPFPEEANRKMISSISSIHLCPTEKNRDNLIKEKIQGKKFVVGNTGLDNLINQNTSTNNEVIITLHRRENIPILSYWLEKLNRTAYLCNDITFTLIKHPNKDIQKYYNNIPNLNVIDSIPHTDMIDRISKCRFIITDSGGLQEEASFLKKQYIVCRKTTERPEGIEFGFGKLCKKPKDLSYMIVDCIDNDKKLSHIPCPFGDGKSSQRVIDIIKRDL